MELETSSPELPDRLEGLRKPSSVVLSGCPREHSRWRPPRDLKREAYRGMHQHWETQWQEFLKTMQTSPVVQENLELADTAPWDDAKGFLASFEQVARACQWPRVEWVARLLPALSGKAEQAFRGLEARDKKDYGKVKAAILREDALRMELQRQHFRQFYCQMSEDPRSIYNQLQELCHQWLRPERRSKEQILELLILEQFLASLPPDLQGWIRAGGPDTCSQALALVEDFMMNQQEDEREMWQEPEMTKAPLDAEGVPSDLNQKGICKEAKQKSNKENNFLGNGHQVTNNSNSLPPPEGHERAEENLTEGPVNPKEMAASLHMVEPSVKQPGPRTMFWQVMQEEDGDIESLEGLLVPKPDLTVHPAEEEEEVEEPMFIQFPVESERLPGQDSGEEKRSRIKIETPQVGEMEVLTGLSQWNIPAATRTVCEQRCDEKISRIKMENPQEGKVGTLAGLCQWNIPVRAAVQEQKCDEKSSVIKVENLPQGDTTPALMEIYHAPMTTASYEQRCELNREQGKQPEQEESSMFPEYLSAATRETSPLLPTRPKKLLVSKSSRKRNCHFGLVMKNIGEDYSECSMSGLSIQQKTCLLTQQKIQMGKKACNSSECRKSFCPRSRLIRHQKIHTSKSPHECLECGKCFISRATLTVHQIIHTGEKPFECPQCRKCFSQRTSLLRHRKIHTGEKVHECSGCGKKFYRKDKLIQHQRIHTREKSYRCRKCGKCFPVLKKRVGHQKII
ncbi:zinc finger protein with KRAB and SCAN domains 1-like isoform X2 [Sceloporus undulatus]|uniref:zinc finger protein with KRAB and SCAN domains 1-like isoform X2 n=1 Tax=Sceloporus undulatus TaxID=8520 RepID=UPI001C4B32EC|nr:zinc finger protein with KRAB and SCAN domains 1-like isoform X2 [Sceloporus undulatus]